MKRFLAVLGLVAGMAVVAEGQGAGAKSFSRHDIFLGIGGGKSFEQHVFNVQYDVAANPNPIFNLGYLYHFSEHGALGLRVCGGIQTIPDVAIVDQSGAVKILTFELTTGNMGFQGRWIASRGKAQPYAYAEVVWASGTLSNAEAGSLDYSGFGLGGGAGVSFILGSHLAFSLEALGSFGSASWSKKPFSNSTGTDFNPSMVGILGNVSLLF